ncbi:MAG: glycoside hydrolase family 27 protein, partial [Fusicatenibacter sp.]
GCDIRTMDEATLRILSNEEIIRINQDPACRQPVKLSGFCSDDNGLMYYRLLSNGDLALGIFNLGEHTIRPSINLDEMGLPLSTGKTLELHEVWTNERFTVTNATLSQTLEPFDCKIFRAKVVDR